MRDGLGRLVTGTRPSLSKLLHSSGAVGPWCQLIAKGELAVAVQRRCLARGPAGGSTSEEKFGDSVERTSRELPSSPPPQGPWVASMEHAIPVNGTVADAKGVTESDQAADGQHKPLTLWPGMYHSPVTAALWHARSSIFERASRLDHDGPAQTTLVTKTPEQCRTSVLYKFSTDAVLREQYRSPWNGCRIGKLLEDLDALAGTIAVRHCSDDDMTTRPLLLVTASVDKISLKKNLSLDSDLMLAGEVAWTGRSSMEIRMTVRQPAGEEDAKGDNSIALTANFTFVARDSKTKRAALVNHLAPQSEAEKALFAEGEARDARRKRERQLHLGNGLPEKGSKNGERLQDLLAEGRVLCEMPALADRNSILIRDTRLENAMICQPQQRNMHGRIFGGFLMRRAYELAYSTCYVFVGSRPRFREVDHVDFHRPVDVGDLLRFKARVLYTETEKPDTPLIHVEVVAFVTQPELRSSLVSNTFYFTFTTDVDGSKVLVRRVLPATEEEARTYLLRYDADHPEKV